MTALRPRAGAEPSLGSTYLRECMLNDCMNQGGVQFKALTVEKLPETQRTGTPSAGSVVGLVARAEEEYS